MKKFIKNCMFAGALFSVSSFLSAAALRQITAPIGLAARAGLTKAATIYKQLVPSVYQALAFLPESKRSKAAVWILRDKYNNCAFSTLSLRDLDALISFVPRQEVKTEWIQDGKGKCFDAFTADEVKNFFTQPSSLKPAKALQILENNSKLSLRDRLSLLSYLSQKDAAVWATKFIEVFLAKEEIDYQDQSNYFKLFDYLSAETQKTLATKYLENAENPFVVLYNFPEKVRAAWVEEKLHSHFDKMCVKDIYKLLCFLPHDDQGYWASRLLYERPCEEILKIRPGCGVTPLDALLSKLSKAQVKSFRVTTYNLCTAILNDEKYANSGPLFSNYHRKFFSQLCIVRSSQAFSETFSAMAEYTYQQYKKGNVVFFHGQGAIWCLLERFYNLFLSVSSKNLLKADTVRLRFTEKTITSEEEALMRQNGVTWSLYSQYRGALLFANLHPFANNSGSNSCEYMSSNYDQTVKDIDTENGFVKLNRFSDTVTEEPQQENSLLVKIKMMAHDLGCQQYFDDHKNEIIECINLYLKANQASGNYGQMVVISMPHQVARKLAYPTKSGGAIQALRMRPWKKTTDVSEIAKNYNSVPFSNEYALILGPTILKNQKEAGIEVKRFSPMLQFKNLFYLEFEKKLEELAHK